MKVSFRTTVIILYVNKLCHLQTSETGKDTSIHLPFSWKTFFTDSWNEKKEIKWNKCEEKFQATSNTLTYITKNSDSKKTYFSKKCKILVERCIWIIHSIIPFWITLFPALPYHHITHYRVCAFTGNNVKVENSYFIDLILSSHLYNFITMTPPYQQYQEIWRSISSPISWI